MATIGPVGAGFQILVWDNPHAISRLYERWNPPGVTHGAIGHLGTAEAGRLAQASIARGDLPWPAIEAALRDPVEDTPNDRGGFWRWIAVEHGGKSFRGRVLCELPATDKVLRVVTFYPPEPPPGGRRSRRRQQP